MRNILKVKVYGVLEYNATQDLHDISLMRLDEEIIMNENVSSIALPTNDESANVNQSCSITGWGLLEGKVFSQVLYNLIVSLKNKNKQNLINCTVFYVFVLLKKAVKSLVICTFYLNGFVFAFQVKLRSKTKLKIFSSDKTQKYSAS